MAKTKTKDTPGQKLLRILYRVDAYKQESEKIAVAPGTPRNDPHHATKRWLAGMSRHLKERFSTELRKLREEHGITQQQLAEIAELTATGVAMIERGERVPNIDTVVRLCWALDVAAGVTLEELA